METWRKRWSSDAGSALAEVYFKRATGALPEMESSKAAIARLLPHLRPNDRILDVGCGAGHYCRTLKAATTIPFSYVGTDATPRFLELAKSAFDGDSNVAFEQGDIFALPFEDASFDIVMSNNLLLHLPSVEKPLRELCRVARRRVHIRTLIGDRSVRIQEVIPTEGGMDAFDANGEPQEFNYFNIYSESYISRLLSRTPGVRSFKVMLDKDFNPERIQASVADFNGSPFTTTILGEWQRNGYILSPWAFAEIEIHH